MDLDAFLCDHAQVVAGKLFISGAGIDVMSMPAGLQPPYITHFAAAGIIRVPWTATNAEHRLEFVLTTDDGRNPHLAGPAAPGSAEVRGEMRFNVGRPPQVASGDEQLVPFAFNFQGLPLMEGGRYILAFSMDGTIVRNLRLTVLIPPTISPLPFMPS